MKKLQDYLGEMTDFRRPQGRRFSLVSMLEMIILAGMSGRFGANPVSRFIENNKEYFIERYQFSHGVPGKTMIHNFLTGLEYKELNLVLKNWILDIMKSQDKSDEWISLDGKSIRSTLSDPCTSAQNYINLVSAFSTSMGLVISTQRHENNKSNEIPCVRELINDLELKGVSFTLDAIHCQKKQLKQSWWEEMTM